MLLSFSCVYGSLILQELLMLGIVEFVVLFFFCLYGYQAGLQLYGFIILPKLNVLMF